MSRNAFRAVLASALFSMSLGGGAANLSFTGDFASDDDAQFFSFAVEGPALNVVTLTTLSYAGGVSAAGAVISPGGFDPVVSLFDGAGTLIAENDDGSDVIDPATGLSLDAFLQINIPAGAYVAALTQSPNFALGPGIADGFELAGTGNFAGGFFDVFGNPRDGHWALDILGVAAAVPSPGTLWLLSVSLLGLALWRRQTHKRLERVRFRP